MLLVEDLLHGQQLDDPTRSPVERGALLLRVPAVAEGDEEASLSTALALAFHDGLEGVDVGAADLVRLLDLDREPVFGVQAAAVGGLGADGKDAAVDARVADRSITSRPSPLT